MDADDVPFDPRERPPEYLYKYRSLSGPSFEFTRKIIQDSAVWFSKPSDFNDPFDCAPALTAVCTDAEYQRYIKGLVKNQARGAPRSERRAEIARINREVNRKDRSAYLKESFDKVVPEVINRAGILSLSAKCDDVLMWSHYADSHQGCCLRFRATSDIFVRARRVHYSRDRPLLNVIRDKHGDMLFKALLSKADFWSYEQEWRVIDHIDGAGSHEFAPFSLDGIVLGARINPKTRAEVMKWVEARDPPVQVLTASFDPKHFRLEIS